MDLITLGAALKGAKTQLDSHFQAGSNILITDNPDGTQTIAASGEVSSEDTVARADIADHVANTSNPHDVKGDQVELHTYAKATEKVAIASGDKVNEALGKLEKKIDDNVINDSTITIKKNGTIVDSFTTNASSGKEINIAVPSTAADVGALADTVKYAGSAAAGGSATSAVKLDNAADSGSLTQPIFFDNGKPKATSYSLAKSVPSDAVFTDTTYESKAAVESGSDVSLVTTGEKYTWNNKQNAISTSSRLAGNAVNMTGYAKASEQAAISSSDVMTTAIGKLEKKADDNKNNILLNWEKNRNKLRYNLDSLKSLNTTGTWTNNVYTVGSLSITINDDLSISVSGTHTATVTLGITGTFDYYGTANALVGMTGQTTSTAYLGLLYSNDGSTWNGKNSTQTSAPVNPLNYTYGKISLVCLPNINHNFICKPMIVPNDIYYDGIPYQPYALSNVELTELAQQNENNISTLNDSTRGIAQSIDVDTLTTGGRYLVNGGDSLTSNAPFAGWQSIEVYQSNIDGYVTLTVQIATELGAGLTRKYRRRTYSGGGQYSAWTSWSS